MVLFKIESQNFNGVTEKIMKTSARSLFRPRVEI